MKNTTNLVRTLCEIGIFAALGFVFDELQGIFFGSIFPNGGSIGFAMIAVLIVVAREFVISGFRLVASDNGVVIAASMWGKFKTATTMVAICLMIVVNELSEVAPFFKELTMILFWVAITLTKVSLVDYVEKNWTVMFAADKEVKPAKEENKETDNTPKFDPNTGEPLQ